MSYGYRGTERYSEVKAKVAQAFKQLRASGFIARQNFLCCMGCASSQLYTNWQKSPRKAKQTACVYFHQQDMAHYREDGILQLRYSAMLDESADQFAHDEAMAAVGREVFRTLKENGLHPIWNGDINQTIEVAEDFEQEMKNINPITGESY